MTHPLDKGWFPISILRPIGYGLLILSLFDVIDILVPPRFMNPAWEFQTIGSLVERVAVPLLGLALVFCPIADIRSGWERFILKVLSWAALVAGVLFLLLSPLLVVNSFRLKDQINTQIETQTNQQIAQLEQLEQRVNAGTPQNIRDAVALLNQITPFKVENPAEAKSKLLEEINKAKGTVRPRIQAAWADRRLALTKNTVKWFLGAVVSGVLFIYIWRVTR